MPARDSVRIPTRTRGSAPGQARRRHWPLRDYPSVVWLFAAAVVSVVHRWIPSSTWLMIHLVLLGALSHAILVWSRYFTDALLKVPATEESRRRQSQRIGMVLVGSALVLVGVPSGLTYLVAAGATLVGLAVCWHAGSLWSELRHSLPGRFRVTVHYYVAAGLSLAIGAFFGGVLGATPGGVGGEGEGRLLLAHTMANLLGWVGLTVLGTLVTFWPTLLRTRMDQRADALARQALPVLVVGLVALVGGALVGMRWVSVAGLVVYVAGVLWWGRALIGPLRAKPPREFAAASVAAALPWALAALVWVGWILVTAGPDEGGWASIVAHMTPVAGIAAVGVGLQLLTGALSYLMPTVLGGGPAVVRATVRVFDRHAALRLVLVNVGLLFLLLPVPSWVSVTTSIVGLVGAVWFLPLVFVAVRVNKDAKAAVERGEPVENGRTTPAEPARLWSAGQVVAALSAMGVAVALGIGVDPAAAGIGGSGLLGGSTQAAAAATGDTVRVAVSANAMRFTPSTVTVKAGDRLVIDLTNDDPAQVHDLVLAGANSGRLAPGESAEVDAGVIGESTQGWCSIAGHRQMGMVFDVVVEGAPAGQNQAGAHAGHDMSGAAGAAGAAGSAGPASPRVSAVADAKLSTHVDAKLPPLPAATDSPTVHKVTLRATEIPLEVAPGVWQTRWTFNDGHMGPTLHGRVGDVFEVTLVNDGTMGHSVDFHAGALAPDRPMRTIAPGESLVYRFTAGRAGAWMYHCSTHPMSQHIAAGMAGAVIIEPRDLPAVDHSYVLVQSEAYVAAGADGKGAATAEAATTLDADKLLARRPDFVTFNGIANQYDQFPLTAKVGERVRVWAVDTGPNVASSLHIVGGQFDTVYSEGGYHLKRGKDAFGSTDGGSQALALQPAQGGFVELTFPEAGHYAVVSHIMSDAEQGAHGIFEISD